MEKTWEVGKIVKLREPQLLSTRDKELALAGFTLALKYSGIELYFTQSLILGSILDDDIHEIAVILPTRYGKTFTVAIAAVLAAAILDRKVILVSCDFKRASLPMNKIVHEVIPRVRKVAPNILQGLVGGDKLEKLSQSANKQRLSWANGGSVEVISVNEGLVNSDVQGQGAIGFGGDLIILDESALLRDSTYSTIRRMLAESSVSKIVEISNPHRTGHFSRLMQEKKENPSVFRVWADAETSIEEGRFDTDSVERAKKFMTSRQKRIYFKCEFPRLGEYAYFKPQRYDILPRKEQLEYYGAVDLALGESTKGSKIAIVVLAKDLTNGQIYEVDSIVRHAKPNETMNLILNLPHRFKKFAVEAIQFQKFFEQELERKSKEAGRYIPFEPMTQSRKKAERIESMEPIVNTGQIFFKGNNELWKEMAEYPYYEWTDGVDALEMVWRTIADADWVPIA